MLVKMVDFGLVVLIWMTQLIVYPSFTYLSENQLLAWHPKYTTAISFIVMPLMLAQVLLHGYDLIEQFHWMRLLATILIIVVWINTFFYAVPLHHKISAQQDMLEAAQGLVKVNWYRTILWTLVFLLNFLPLKS